MLFNLKGDVLADGNGVTMAGKEKVTHVRLNAGVLIDGEHHDAGEIVTVPVELGADLIGSRRGEEIEDKDLAEAKAAAAAATDTDDEDDELPVLGDLRDHLADLETADEVKALQKRDQRVGAHQMYLDRLAEIKAGK